MRAALRYFLTCLIVLAAVVFTGCFGASPMIKRERGPSGNQLEKYSLDSSFVQFGITSRAEVLEKLNMINTGDEGPGLFWGRWSSSKWGYGWAVIAVSGGGSAAGDAKRVWHVHNLLLSFDEKGVVQTRLDLDDDASLFRELHKYVAKLPPVDSAEAVSFPDGNWGEKHISFASDGISAGRSRGKVRVVHFTPDKVIRFRHSAPKDKRNDAGTTCHVLELSEKTAFGRNLSFCATGPNLIATYRYLQRFGTPSMKWE